jgi:predicted AAA+ superfamily ATPase
VRDTLAENTERFAGPASQQRPALGRARHGQVLVGQGGPCRHQPAPEGDALPLKLIEIHREDIESLPALMGLLRPIRIAPSSSATISPSTATTPPTSR